MENDGRRLCEWCLQHVSCDPEGGWEYHMYECAYCGCMVECTAVPQVSDQRLWGRIRSQHAPGCAWVRLGGHLAEGMRVTWGFVIRKGGYDG